MPTRNRRYRSSNTGSRKNFKYRRYTKFDFVRIDDDSALAIKSLNSYARLYQQEGRDIEKTIQYLDRLLTLQD